jgi:hypothetical protein
MQTSNRFAFKEWAAVCEALRLGRQSLILRKGGIHEGREGFRVEHREFWLFPTEFHQQPDVLTSEGQRLLDEVQARDHSPDELRIREYAVVEGVIEIRDESLLPGLLGLHVWSEQTLHARFHYRTPGLFALCTRIYQRSEPLRMPNSPHFGGCRSWVDFPTDITTEELEPVLSDAAHNERMQMLRRTLTSASVL